LIRNLVNIADFSREEINQIYKITTKLKDEVKNNIKHHHLENKTLIMLFEKPSARTRISFETGMFQLGGKAIFLGPNDLALGKRESIEDLARVLSRYNDMIMARVFDHDHLVKLAKFSTVPVINGLTNYNHPCQILSDGFTILEKFGKIENLTISFIGDGNNVFHSWLYMAQRFPLKINIACPKGYEPNNNLVKKTRKIGISTVNITNDPYEIISESDIIYTDVWASMGQEKESMIRTNKFSPFQVNEKLMKEAGQNSYFFHCLPAHRGKEVTDEIIDGKQSVVFDQAENRLHVQKAIMVYLMK
tara:strand:+ start:60 stop:971 length:912 start_codon:yes stop_codon:yes gene_type:complete